MRYFYSENAYPVKYIISGHLISKDNFVHDKRIMKDNVLIMVEEGVLHIASNGSRYSIGPGQYIVLKKNELHEGYKPSSGRLTYNWVHFNLPEAFVQLTKEKAMSVYDLSVAGNQIKGKVMIKELGKVAKQQKGKVLFNQLLDLSRQDQLFSDEVTDYALSLLLMTLTQEAFDQYAHLVNNIHPSIARIMEWIKANYYNHITVKEVAFEFAYNPDYLSALFKQSTKITLIQYVNRTRIDVSKSLLTNYDISIKEIAYSCGFHDPKYYMKVFKSTETMTPTQYRNAFTRSRINR